MSQSDYIKYKRVATELKELSTLPSVIDAGQYTGFKEFSLENSIISNKINYAKLLPANSINVFGIQRFDAPNCAKFQLCLDTNSRSNRRPLRGVKTLPTPLPSKPIHSTLDKSDYCKQANCKD